MPASGAEPSAYNDSDVVPFIELASSQVLHQKWREIVVDIAAAQSTLQDISLPESCGYHCYRECGRPSSPCYNRFIYWKTFNDQLELVELSSELNLIGNQVRIKFINAPIIQAVNVEELPEYIVLMCATVSSVHRIVLPHPRLSVSSHNVATKQYAAHSILAKLSAELMRDPGNYYVLNNELSSYVPTTGVQHPISATSWLEADSRLATFALSYPRGSILVIKFLDSHKEGRVTTWELKQTSIIGRLWSKMPALLAKNNTGETEDATLQCIAIRHNYCTDEGYSMCDHLLLALCRDYKLRIWSTLARECVHVHSLLLAGQENLQTSFTQSFNQSTSSGNYHGNSTRQPLVDLSNHHFSMRVSSRDTNNLFVLVHTADDPNTEFILLEYSFINGAHKFERPITIATPVWDSLIDFGLTCDRLWALTLNADDEHVVYYRDIDINSDSQQDDVDEQAEWNQVYLADCDSSTYDVQSMLRPLNNATSDSPTSLADLYIDEIFWKNRFSLATIAKAVSILNRGLDTSFSLQQIGGKNVHALIEAATQIIKNSVRSALPNDTQHNISATTAGSNTNTTDDDSIEKEAWNKFYTYCVQNHQVSNKMIGLLLHNNEQLMGLIKRGNFSLLTPAPLSQILSIPHQLVVDPACGLELGPMTAKQANLLDYFLVGLNSISRLVSDDGGTIIDQYLAREPAKVHELLGNLASCWMNTGALDLAKLVGHDSRSGRNSGAQQAQHYIQLGTCIKLLVDALDMGTFEQGRHSDEQQRCEPNDRTPASPTSVHETTQTNLNASAHQQGRHRSMAAKGYMTSNYGISCVYELLRRQFRSRLQLVRNLCIVLNAIDRCVDNCKSGRTPSPDGGQQQDNSRPSTPEVGTRVSKSRANARATAAKINADLLAKFSHDLIMSYTVARAHDALRCYSTLCWVADTPIKEPTRSISMASYQALGQLVPKFRHFKQCNLRNQTTLPAQLNGDSTNNGESNVPMPAPGPVSKSAAAAASLHRNILTDFLVNGGAQLAQTEAGWSRDMMRKLSLPNRHTQAGGEATTGATLSHSRMLAEFAQAVTCLLWPKSRNLCLAEYMVCCNYHDHLARYLLLLDDWQLMSENDRNFLQAFNCLLDGRPSTAVHLFTRLWMNMTPDNLIGRFIDLSSSSCSSSSVSLSGHEKPFEISASMIYKYFENLIQLFKLYDCTESIVDLIQQAILLLSGTEDSERANDNVSPLGSNEHSSTQSQTGEWINMLRTQLFKYYLDLDQTEDAYQAMVLNSDPDQRNNCLHQFIVYHCDTNQWKGLLAFPYFDLRDDFVNIFEQRAATTDLLRLAKDEFQRPSYYEILYSFFIREEQLERAAGVIYEFAQRLCQEVPGVKSIAKQADCLLIVMNCLRCLRIQKQQQQHRSVSAMSMSNGHTGVNTNTSLSIKQHNLKRGYDCDPEPHSPAPSSCVVSDCAVSTVLSPIPGHQHNQSYQQHREQQQRDTNKQQDKFSRVGLRQVEVKYELTRARLRLLEKEPKANAIALSPLRTEEIISYLVSSSMFTYAFDLCVLLRAPMEPIMEGLASRYIFLTQLSPLDLARDSALQQSVSDCFVNNYITNATADAFAYLSRAACDSSTRSPVDRLWLLIDYYLDKYDGVSHMCSDRSFVGTFANTTVLMRVVANKLLQVGYTLPASLTRRYMARNPAELLRLLIKYDQLMNASDVCTEMLDNVMLDAPPPVYMPTHHMLALIEYLNEDATNKDNVRIGNELKKKLFAYRHYMLTQSSASLYARY